MFKNKETEEEKIRGAHAKGHRRPDGALDTNLGKAGHEPGSGADLASTDMEVPEPSNTKD